MVRASCCRAWLACGGMRGALSFIGLITVICAACSDTSAVGESDDEYSSSCRQEPAPSRGVGLLQLSGQPSQQRQMRPGHQLLQKMESYIEEKGKTGLSPDEKTEVQEIRSILNDNLLPTLQEAAADAQAELSSLFQDILDCQGQATSGLQINEDEWDDVVVKQKNVTACMQAEVMILDDEVETCKDIKRLKTTTVQFPVVPPTGKSKAEVYKFLQDMSEQFCGAEKSFTEKSEECDSLKQNRTDLSEDCTLLQKHYEQALCAWKAGLVRTCRVYTGCWNESVGRYTARANALKNIEDDQISELKAVKKLDCLWEAWNFSTDPCTVDTDMVKGCEKKAIDLMNVTLKIFEVPEPKPCAPPVGSGYAEVSDVPMPCSEEYISSTYRPLGFPKEELERIQQDCHKCPEIPDHIPTAPPPTTTTVSSSEPFGVSKETTTGEVGSSTGSFGVDDDDEPPLSTPEGRAPTTEGPGDEDDNGPSSSTATAAATTAEGRGDGAPTTEAPGDEDDNGPSSSTTTAGATTAEGPGDEDGTATPGEPSSTTSAGPTTGAGDNGQPSSTTSAKESSQTTRTTTKTTTVTTTRTTTKTTTTTSTTTTIPKCGEAYSVTLLDYQHDSTADTTEFTYEVMCMYGAQDIAHWDLVEFNDLQLGTLEELFVTESSTEDVDWLFDVEAEGVLAIQAAGAMQCKSAPPSSTETSKKETFKLAFVGEVKKCDGEYRILTAQGHQLVGEACSVKVPCAPEEKFEPTTTTTTSTTTQEPPATTTTTTTTTLCPTACQAPVCTHGDQSKGGWLLDEGKCTVSSSAPDANGKRSCGLGEAFEGDGSVFCTKCIIPEALCILWGDPHIKPFDHKGSSTNVHMYPYGDYWIVKSAKVWIQARYWSTRGDGNSQIRGLAFGGEFLKDNILFVFPQDGKMLWNEEEILKDYPSSHVVPGLLYAEYHDEYKVVRPRGGRRNGIKGLDIRLPMGVRATINRFSSHLDALITVRQMEGGLDGHCGNFNGDASDDSTRTITQRMGGTVKPEQLLFAKKDYELIGCYAEKSNDRDLTVKRGSNLNHEECSLACVEYPWFGVQGNSDCYCGQSFGKHGETTGCNCQLGAKVGNNKQCVYGFFDSVQPPARTLDDCVPDKLHQAETLCGNAVLKDGLSQEQKDEFLYLCKMDVCFGDPGFAKEDAWAMVLQAPCATLADIQRVCGKQAAPCSIGIGATPDNCKMNNCEEYNRLGWFDSQVRLLADGQARGDKVITSLVQTDHRPGICITVADTLEICGGDQCSRTDVQSRRSDMEPMEFSSEGDICLRDEASFASKFFIMSFKMKPSQVSGTRAIRAASGNRAGRVRLYLHNGRLRLEIKGGDPSYQQFEYTFDANTEYDVRVAFDGIKNSAKMFLSGKLEEAKTYKKVPPAPVIHDGFIGCHDANMAGEFKDKFKGKISKFYLQVVSTTATTTPPFEPISFNSKEQACYRENRFLETDFAEVTFKMKPTSLPSWSTIRLDDRWLSASLHLQLHNDKLEFAIKGGQPQSPKFNFKFKANTEYDIRIVYDRNKAKTKFYVDGQLEQTLTYSRAVNMKITPGYIGCWDQSGQRNFQRKFQGTITDFFIKASPPKEEGTSYAMVVEGSYCQGHDCTSKVHCPLQMSAVACDTIPYNAGNGAYMDTKTGECFARGAGDGQQVKAKATCIEDITTTAVRSPGWGEGELSVSCPTGQAISCNCYSQWYLSGCDGESFFAPTDGMCKKKVKKAAIFAICSETNVAVVEGDECTGDDCRARAPCPDGMSNVLCEVIPWNGQDGVRPDLKTGVCTAMGKWGSDATKGRAVCVDSGIKETHVVATTGVTNGPASVSCPDGDPISCTCHSWWTAKDNCYGRVVFNPTNGVCAANVKKADLYAICPGGKTTTTTTTTTTSVDITFAMVVEGDPCSGDGCTSKVSCPGDLSVVACDSNPWNSGDGSYMSTDTGECIARGSNDGATVSARATCIEIETYSVTPGSRQGHVRMRCPEGKEAISCNCYSSGGLKEECSGVGTFAPTDGLCEMTVGNAEIYAICSETKVEVVEGETCTGDDCKSEARCSSGMFAVTCQTIPWDGADGSIWNLKTGVCIARGSYRESARGRATCMKYADYPMHLVKAPVASAYSQSPGMLSVECPDGEAVICTCHSFWTASSNCGGTSVFAPVDGVCARNVGRASLYAVCTGATDDFEITTTTTERTTTTKSTTTSAAAPQPKRLTDWVVVEGASGNAVSKAYCPSGMSVIACDTDPYASGDGSFMDQEDKACVARRRQQNELVSARATCMRIETFSVVGAVSKEKVQCDNSAKAVSCNCYSAQSMDEHCDEEIAPFDPQDNGKCEMDVEEQGQIVAICSKTRVLVITSDECDDHDCEAKAQCPNDMEVAVCQSIPWSSTMGAYLKSTKECVAKGYGEDVETRARAVCIKKSAGFEITKVKAPSSGWSTEGTLTVGCPEGKSAISCNCFSKWGASSNCGGVTSFLPKDGVCKLYVVKAKLYAVCGKTEV